MNSTEEVTPVKSSRHHKKNSLAQTTVNFSSSRIRADSKE